MITQTTKAEPKIWRWILERCGCDTQGQMPVADNNGEDCNAYEKLNTFRQEAETCDVCKQKFTYHKGGSNW